MNTDHPLQTLGSRSFPHQRKGLLGVVVGMGLALGLIFLPSSPLAIVRADFLHGMDRTDAALVLYDQIAEQSLVEGQRMKALRRGAGIWALAKGNDVEARKRWEALAKQSPNRAEQAMAWERVGYFHSQQGRHPELAAQAYERSATLYHRDDKAAEQWMEAGSHWEKALNIERATQVWLTVTEQYLDYRSDAFVALGQSNLGQGRAEQALSWFDDAVDSAHSETQLGLAKMGLAMTLERLGNLDEAIAELNGAGLPDDVRDVRRRKMQERSDNLQMN